MAGAHSRKFEKRIAKRRQRLVAAGVGDFLDGAIRLFLEKAYGLDHAVGFEVLKERNLHLLFEQAAEGTLTHVEAIGELSQRKGGLKPLVDVACDFLHFRMLRGGQLYLDGSVLYQSQQAVQ